MAYHTHRKCWRRGQISTWKIGVSGFPGGEGNAPNLVIDPNDEEIVINATQDFDITCYSNRPILWSTPKSRYVSAFRGRIAYLSELGILQENDNSSSLVEITESEWFENNVFPYKSALRLVNASYADTGYYYCYEDDKGESRSDRANSSMVYLFVSGESRKLAIHRETRFSFYV